MTTREWFRTLRTNHQPMSEVEGHILASLRADNWLEAEFWTLLYFSTKQSFQATGEHDWRLDDDNYTWLCWACGATVPSDEIGETKPPRNQFSDDCQCSACLPCKGYQTTCPES